MSDADEVVFRTVHAADRAIVATGSVSRIRDLVEQADAELARKLAKEALRVGGINQRFTGARLQAYSEQLNLVLARVKPRLVRRVGETSAQAIARAHGDTVRVVKKLEERYTGAAVALDLDRVQVLDSLAKGRKGTLLMQHRASVERYGEHVVLEYERQMRLGLLQGETQREMVARLTGHGLEGAPPGIFRRQAYWARRIVRTETAYAYNAAQYDATAEGKKQFPDMAKKIIATFDSRTAADSVYVHGQIRDLNEMFEDGKGRRYLHPPGRPNDREVIIPWRKSWAELPVTKMKPAWHIADVEVEALPKYQQPHGPLRYTAEANIAARVKAERKRQAELRRQARRLQKLRAG